MKPKCFLILAIVLITFGFGCQKQTKQSNQNDSALNENNDSILFSFAFVGCNRIQASDKNSKYTNSSTANIPELQRTFDEISKLQPKPKYFFFLGDLVLGLDQNPRKLNGQLQSWLNQANDPHFSMLAGSGIQLIALPGNHEMLFKDSESHDELPWKDAINIWQSTMTGLMPSEKLNRVSGPDSIFNQQTYSFDFLNTHFIVLNTDTWNNDSLIGTFPLSWVESDIIAASMNKQIAHTFLLSHKPIWVSPNNGKDDTVQDSLGKALWKVMERYHVEALFSAHSHQYQRNEPHKGESIQIIAGNGGSQYTKSIDREAQFMGYCIVEVLQNGDVILKSMGRCIKLDEYLGEIPKHHHTLLRDSVNLRWGVKRKKWPKALLNPCGK